MSFVPDLRVPALAGVGLGHRSYHRSSCRCVAAVCGRSSLAAVTAASQLARSSESSLWRPGQAGSSLACWARERCLVYSETALIPDTEPGPWRDQHRAIAAPFAVTRPSHLTALLKSGNRQTISDKTVQKNRLGLSILVANFNNLFIQLFFLFFRTVRED